MKVAPSITTIAALLVAVSMSHTFAAEEIRRREKETSTAHLAGLVEPAATKANELAELKDGEYTLKVTLRTSGSQVQSPSSPIPDAAYKPFYGVKVSIPLQFTENGKKVSINGGSGVAGALEEQTATERIYSLTEGLFAGGQLRLKQTADGIIGTYTLYGSGEPVLSSIRGVVTPAKGAGAGAAPAKDGDKGAQAQPVKEGSTKGPAPTPKLETNAAAATKLDLSKAKKVTAAAEWKKLYAQIGDKKAQQKSGREYQYLGHRDSAAFLGVKQLGPNGPRALPSIAVRLDELDAEFRARLFEERKMLRDDGAKAQPVDLEKIKDKVSVKLGEDTVVNLRADGERLMPRAPGEKAAANDFEVKLSIKQTTATPFPVQGDPTRPYLAMSNGSEKPLRFRTLARLKGSKEFYEMESPLEPVEPGDMSLVKCWESGSLVEEVVLYQFTLESAP